MTEKEQKISTIAVQLFFRHGYSKVTMLDIAEAAEISRPTLYASFENKEAVLSALLQHSAQQYELEAAAKLLKKKNLKERLEIFYDVWVIQPFASIVDSENRADILLNCDKYAPAATNELYARLEAQLATLLKPHMARRKNMTANDLAHILATATRGLKSTTRALDELQRMADGLITMAVATVRKS